MTSEAITPENPAHAEIFGHPPFDADKVFDRIKQALARIATVTLPPAILTDRKSNVIPPPDAEGSP